LGVAKNTIEDGCSMTHDIRFESAGITDRGVVRADNQDQFFVAELTRSLNTLSSSLALQAGTQLTGAKLGQLLMVADGMGGHSAGMEASRLAVHYFIAAILNRTRWLLPNSDREEAELIEDLKVILNQSHREIKHQSEQVPELAGMGTTFTMAYVIWPKMYIVHAGDTRCYLFRRGKLQLLTSDHTVAEQLIRSGKLSPDATQRSPWSNVLFNALGANADAVQADISAIDLEDQDLVLMCSDGLNKHVEDSGIQSEILKNSEPDALCRSLVEQANAKGGTDNITIVAARWSRIAHGDGMPIYQSAQQDPSLFHEIAFPIEDYETGDFETARLSSTDLRDAPTEPVDS
jgi:serine/threonine protein phosphatase PrpC